MQQSECKHCAPEDSQQKPYEAVVKNQNPIS